MAAIDEAIGAQARNGNLDAVLDLQKEKEAFTSSGRLPSSKLLAAAVAEYKTTLQRARRNLETAYEAAIKEYTRALKIDEAKSVQRQLEALREGTGREVKVRKGAFVYTFYDWQVGQAPLRMLHKDEGFCYLLGIKGAFNGGGESVQIVLEKDGYWYLTGHSLAGPIEVRAVGVSLLTE
jgi:hypothetical protein